jgi:small subunit ribosomal protein S17
MTEPTENTTAAEVDDTVARGRRKVREGYVVSVLRTTSKVKAHDEENSAGVGDRVLLMETRPLSATKRWRLVQILEKAK